MTMTLPLLPPEMFQEALFIIQTEADLLSNEHPNILQFMSYLRLTWSNMASKISTYRCPVRTNNIVESFHNIAVQKLGTTNINVWTFLGNVFKYFVSMFICIFYYSMKNRTYCVTRARSSCILFKKSKQKIFYSLIYIK